VYCFRTDLLLALRLGGFVLVSESWMELTLEARSAAELLI